MLAGSALAQSALPVVAKRYAELALHPEHFASASVVSANESRIAAEVAAVIVEIPVEVGQVIAKGAVVARLETRDYEIALERARSALEAARARLALSDRQAQRARDLFARQFISQDALAQRETEVAVLRADVGSAALQLAAAERSLAKCVIRAPFRAVVKARGGQLGELAAPGAVLATLVEADRVEVSAAVQSDDVRSIEQAKSMRFESQGAIHELKMLRLAPAFARESRTREARLAFRGAGALPGAEGRIRWQDYRSHVPPALMVRRGGVLGVFVLKGDAAEFVAMPDAQEGRPAALALEENALVITEGRHALRHGQKVVPAKQ